VARGSPPVNEAGRAGSRKEVGRFIDEMQPPMTAKEQFAGRLQ